MYPHYIEVHDKGNREPFLVNVDNIITIGMQGLILAGIPDDIALATDESYEELKDLIISAGCHIEKADPRLDITLHLTMDDLQGMVGEPVWSSNTNTWLLVYDGDWTYSGDPDRVCVRVVNRYGCKDIWLSEEDLIAKPLYRMKAG